MVTASNSIRAVSELGAEDGNVKLAWGTLGRVQMAVIRNNTSCFVRHAPTHITRIDGSGLCFYRNMWLNSAFCFQNATYDSNLHRFSGVCKQHSVDQSICSVPIRNVQFEKKLVRFARLTGRLVMENVPSYMSNKK